MRDNTDLVTAWIDGSTRVVALTGAGISTDSGIPDFRGPQGVWTENSEAERLSNIHHYISAPEVPRVIARALRAAEQAELLLAVGSSLQVYPVAAMVPAAHASGARVVIVNAEPTPFDDLADAVFRQPIGQILPALCGPALSGR